MLANIAAPTARVSMTSGPVSSLDATLAQQKEDNSSGDLQAWDPQPVTKTSPFCSLLGWSSCNRFGWFKKFRYEWQRHCVVVLKFRPLERVECRASVDVGFAEHSPIATIGSLRTKGLILASMLRPKLC